MYALGVPSEVACGVPVEPKRNAPPWLASVLAGVVPKLKLGTALKLNPAGSVVGLLKPVLSELFAPNMNKPPLVLPLAPEKPIAGLLSLTAGVDEKGEKAGVAVVLVDSPNLKIPL